MESDKLMVLSSKTYMYGYFIPYIYKACLKDLCNKENNNNKPKLNMKPKDIIWLTVFSIAMGLLECAVVVYIRELYYPAGFSFPLVIISNRVAVTELLRETATLIMIMGIAYFTGKNFITRFGSFLYVFAIWDIFYYIFLWLILGWPESLFTWDVLFLIPVIWVGPVVAPVIVSLTMIMYAFIFWHKNQQSVNLKLKKSDWLLLISASLIIILSFTWDFMDYLLGIYNLKEIFSLNNAALINLSTHYIPMHFNWILFSAGELLLIITICLFYKRKDIAITRQNINL